MLIKTDIFNEKAKSKFCAVPPYWLADGFSMNGFAISGECLSSAESGVAASLSVNCRRIVKGGRGGGTGLLAGQTNSFVNWRRQVRSIQGARETRPWESRPRFEASESESPAKYVPVVFCRQVVSWLASCEKGRQLQLPCGIKTIRSWSPMILNKKILVWKMIELMQRASIFRIARPASSILLASVQKQPKHAHSSWERVCSTS